MAHDSEKDRQLQESSALCGINVIFGPASRAQMEGMNRRLIHRGPDAQGVFEGEGLLLGSTRLKIIDLNHGDMPMVSPCGRYHFVFNGEIYNYKSLKKQVGGYSFSSESDTEVFFALLQKRGIQALQVVNGMFSFALWDKYEKTLTIGRDRLGIKPLFYAVSGNRVIISSELGPFDEFEECKKGLDQQAMHHYLSLLSVPEPWTMFPGIRRFPAAHYAVIKNAEVEPKPYWSLNFRKTSRSKTELKEEIQQKLRQSIQKRLISDVPLGVMLSSGLDSNLIIRIMHEMGQTPLRSFSLSFAGGDDETLVAEKTARDLGLEHHSFHLDSHQLLSSLPKIIGQFGEPFAGGLPMWFLCQSLKPHATVVLSGTGGDEMFGNYGRSAHLDVQLGLMSGLKASKLYGPGIVNNLFSPKMRECLKRGAPLGHLYHEKVYPMKEWQKNKLMRYPARMRTDMWLDDLFWEPDELDVKDRTFALDLNTQLKNEFLYSQDILSMAHQVEVRVPFLDHEFVELMASVPAAWRSSPSDPKGWYREIFKPQLPENILSRPKKGFMVPYGDWLRGPLKPFAEQLFNKEDVRRQELLNPEALQLYWQEHCTGKNHTYLLWSILMFQLWFRLKENEKLDWLS